MEISLNHFLNLRLGHVYHDYHVEGTTCIYQDLVKKKYTIRQMLMAISTNPEYLSIDKYQRDEKMRTDHMSHYVNCIIYGFRKNIDPWKDANKESLIDKNFYLSKAEMSDDEIRVFLNKNKIILIRNKVVGEGLHRCFCMMGRILRGEKYIPLIEKNESSSFWRMLNRNKIPKIKNTGYRTKHNLSRLNLILPHINKEQYTVIDIGSNFGFFSMSLAAKAPLSAVYSIEGSSGTGNDALYDEKKDINAIALSTGVNSHKSLKEKYSLFNNHILCSLFTADMIDQFIESGIVFDYQLSLSVFHWVVFGKYGNSGDAKDIISMLIKHLSCAKSTFIELPEPNQETSMSPAYGSHTSVDSFMKEIIEQHKLNISVEILGEHNWCGKRQLLKITQLSQVDIEKIFRKDIIDIIKPVEIY